MSLCFDLGAVLAFPGLAAIYFEDYFLAKDISNFVDLSKLKEAAEITPVLWSSTQIVSASNISEQFSLANWERIPNLLSEKY